MSNRLSEARAAVLKMFTLSAHLRNEDSRTQLEAALSEVEAAAVEQAAQTPADPVKPPETVQGVVGMNSEGLPIVAEIPPPPSYADEGRSTIVSDPPTPPAPQVAPAGKSKHK